MKFIQVKIRLFYLMFAIPVCSMARNTNEYQEMKLTGKITPVGNLRYVDSVEAIYRSSRVYPLGGQISIKVPVQNNRFSIWVPPLPAGEFMFVRFLYGKVPDSADKINHVTAFLLMIGDSLVDLSFEKGGYDARSRKYKVGISILAGEQNKARHTYITTVNTYDRIKDTLKMQLFEKKIDSAFYKVEMQKLNEVDKQFIIDNPDALQSLLLIEKIAGKYLRDQVNWNSASDTHLKEIEALFGLLSNYLQKSERGRRLITNLQQAGERKVIPFTGTMPNGRQFDLNSLKGKVFLIDFWGSWCGWCRKGHPHLKKLYAKYKDKGFEIIGVGEEFGTGKPQWDKFKKAIADDGIPWSQVLNDRSKQDIVSLYMVTSYPSKFLIDREGHIILRVGTDSERLLDAKLKEVFGE